VVPELPGHQADRQRQVPAHLGQFGHGVIVGPQAGTSGELDEQLRGVTGLQDI